MSGLLKLNFDYASCVAASEKVAWRLDDIMPVDRELDFSRPFLPEEFSVPRGVVGLEHVDWLRLNQITGHSYLNLFAFVEEYIIATVVQHQEAEVYGDRNALRALARFADEEVKHQLLFHRYKDAFARGFPTPCRVLDSAVEVAGMILSKSSLAVMLITLHLELITQQHYTDCVRGKSDIDPLFTSLLHQHWLEEAQHAKIDMLELDKYAVGATAERLSLAFAEYVEILHALEGLMSAQAEWDLQSLEAARGLRIAADGRAELHRQQAAAYHSLFILAGLCNHSFIKVISQLPGIEVDALVETASQFEGSRR